MDSHPSRPLSPHLQVYRLPLTAWLSISHRISGVILSIGLLAIVMVLLAVAESPFWYEAGRKFLASWVGKGLLLLWVLALFIHVCHGIRHLLWDIGIGLERLVLSRYSRWELGTAVGLTLIAWLMLIG